jgi:hypothetical protein
MEVVAGFLLIGLVGWAGWLALLVVQIAATGSRYVQWSADPLVLIGELLLAGCFVVVAIAAVVLVGRRLNAGTAGSADTFGWIGIGFLAVGGIAVAVGWLGLRVPTTPGYDVLSRGEPLFIIYGAVSAAFGLLLAIAAGVAASLGAQPDRDETGGGARPSLSWAAPDAPTWRVLRCGLLHGAGPGDLVIVGTEEDSVVIAVQVDRGVRRVATYPAGVRLEPTADGGHRLVFGADEIALLSPVDADPAVLAAALEAAAG